MRQLVGTNNSRYLPYTIDSQVVLDFRAPEPQRSRRGQQSTHAEREGGGYGDLRLVWTIGLDDCPSSLAGRSEKEVDTPAGLEADSAKSVGTLERSAL